VKLYRGGLVTFLNPGIVLEISEQQGELAGVATITGSNNESMAKASMAGQSSSSLARP